MTLESRPPRAKRRLLPALILLGLLLPGSAAEARAKIGLVLSGGGALGAAHVGVLKVLEELRIPIDVITGTSMGAVVGGLYASGKTAAELEALIDEIDWVDLFKDTPPRDRKPFRRKQDDYSFLVDLKLGFNDGQAQLPTGLIQGQKLALTLRELSMPVRTIRNFDDLPIRYRAVAADVETGTPVVLGSGDLARAMLASMSVPGVLPPIEIDGHLLVDGGVADNLPIDVARKLGAEVLIVADLPTVLKKREKLNSALAIAQQMISVLIQQNSQIQLKTLRRSDIHILPDLGDMGSSDFVKMKGAIAPGEAATRKELAALSRLSLSPAEYQAFRGGSQPPVDAPPAIAFVDIENRSRLTDKLIAKTMAVETGKPLDKKKLDGAIERLYALGEFERIDYQVIEKDGKTGLLITAQEKSWAKNYFNFGLNLADDFDGNASYNLAGTLTLTALNPLGAEWRNEVQIGEEPRLRTEFFQPLDDLREFFVAPELLVAKRNVDTSNPLTGRSLFQATVAQASLAGGWQLGTWGEWRAGYRRGIGSTSLQIGSAPRSELGFEIGEVFSRFSVDTLDDVRFPKTGTGTSLELVQSVGALGATTDYQRGELIANKAFNWDRNTVVVGGHFGSSVDDNLPLQSRFPLGGFLNLSGLSHDRLSGQNQLFGRLVYYRTLTSAAPELFDIPLYLGASLESGNVWEHKSQIDLRSLRYAGSAFIGADTYVGPLYLAYGRADEDQSSIYLFLGRTF